MLPLISIVAIIFLGANCQRRTDSFVYRVSFSFICLFGFIITSGLVAGFLSFRITDLIVRIAIGAIFLLLLLLNWRVINSRQQGSKLVRPTVTAMAILPTFFLLGVGILFVIKTSHNMHFLLSTIDGTTNPGFVTALRFFEQISSFSKQKGLEGYPIGMHYVASWFADLYPSFTQPSSLWTVQAFSATLFVVYALIIAQVGELTRDLCGTANLKKSFQLTAGFGPQLLLVSPFFVKNLLMLYSLAFLGALSVTLSMILFSLKRQRALADKDNHRGGIVISLGLLMLSVSYPTFLLVGISLLIIFLFQPSISHTFVVLVRNIFGKMVLVLLSFSLAIVAIQSYSAVINQLSAFSPGSSSNVSRFSLSGHLISLDGLLVLMISLLAIASALFFYKRRLVEARILFLFLTPVLLTVIASWLLSNSFDRSYGLNYYAKKSEYQLVVLLAPLAFYGFFQVVEWLARLTKNLSFVVFAFVLATAFSTSIIVRDGMFGALIVPTISNKTQSKLMTYALQEAEIDGRSIIWDDSLRWLSQQSSMMSAQIDPTSWLEPDMDNLFIVMVQQLSIHDSTQPWISSCGFLNSRNFGRGHIVEIAKKRITEC
jgi:hypothetical protein